MIRPPVLRLHADELIVDNFAGGGGASLGIEWALGRSPDIAINHDPQAVAMHAANHPATRHYVEDVWKVDPVKACGGRPVGLAWFSPDCKHFSKAKGGKPVSKKIRGLAWIVVKWAKLVRPRVICLENVEEFQDWGPLGDDDRPCKLRKGFTFQRWKAQLENLGYRVEWREIIAADYGAPTTRKRLFLVARCDGQPIRWPAPTHGKHREPYRTAAECIDWTLPCPSIFLTSEEAKPLGIKRPLAENTMRRIARGLKKFVIDNPQPFIVPVVHGAEPRAWSIDEPMRTITGAHRGDRALVTPFVTRIGQTGGHGAYSNSAEQPLSTIVSKNEHLVTTAYLAGVGGRKGQSPETGVEQPYHTITAKADTVLIAPTLVTSGYGERRGQGPRAPGLDKPLGTVVAGGAKHALVSAFLAKHFGGHETPGSPLAASMDTITSRDHHGLVAAHLTHLYTSNTNGGQGDLFAPVKTITAEGQHHALSSAFLTKYYGGNDAINVDAPLRTVTAADRFGLVMVKGEAYVITDIGMRMLVPRELYIAQGFPTSYRIDITYKGKPLPKDAQVRMCGNSVSPYPCAALVLAQFAEQQEAEAA